jgi:hypothetical protein
METAYYLDKFQKSVDRFDMKLFSQKKQECKVGIWLDSVVLKIQKKSWINTAPTSRPFKESIFFSIWLNDELIRDRKLYYNIHALKLRQLVGYSIKSREFADAFRARFKPFEKRWPNVSVNFGPLTLMEGWIALDDENLEAIIMDLAYKFLEIEFIIDDLLEARKKSTH